MARNLRRNRTLSIRTDTSVTNMMTLKASLPKSLKNNAATPQSKQAEQGAWA
ncbi:hypothetical protein [Duganella sp. HH101]|uniref:hypothetical protein n=1 Tax=Duganella sp. HH101 TaxID=1781066 RepID=UPI00143A04DB|nr:hypothetical protein [Duganella sp. HH101]